MGYQIAVNYTGLFAGKILRVRPTIKLFGNPSYEIELMEVFQRKCHTKIWISEDLSLPFNKEKFEIAIIQNLNHLADHFGMVLCPLLKNLILTGR
jgi:hypothetical protein